MLKDSSGMEGETCQVKRDRSTRWRYEEVSKLRMVSAKRRPKYAEQGHISS